MTDATYGDLRLPDGFWVHVYPCPLTGCWLWAGGGVSRGYGRVAWRGKQWYTHRLAFAQLVHAISDGLFVLHHCDTPACVNPTHLFEGTQATNLQDMSRKRRSVRLQPAEVGRLFELRADGLTVEKIAETLAVSRGLVSRVLRGGDQVYPDTPPNPVPGRQRAGLSVQDRQRVQTMARDSATCQDIATEFGVSRSTAWRWLHSWAA